MLMLTYNQMAVVVATLVASMPVLMFVRTLSLAYWSRSRFLKTTGHILQHDQPSSEDGDPIQIRLKYEYMVNGQVFHGKRYFFGSLNMMNAAFLEKYPAGSDVNVFYDPRKPSRSTLETGVSPRIAFWGCVALVAAAMLWLITWILAYATWSLGSEGTSSVL